VERGTRTPATDTDPEIVMKKRKSAAWTGAKDWQTKRAAGLVEEGLQFVARVFKPCNPANEERKEILRKNLMEMACVKLIKLP
jgi:hypothetical protein